jgi:hypothetical protein
MRNQLAVFGCTEYLESHNSRQGMTSIFALSADWTAATGDGVNVTSRVPLLGQYGRSDVTSNIHWRNWLLVTATTLPQRFIAANVSKPSNTK